MTDQFVAEIRMFGFNFAPIGWATCDGQQLPISQNTALFSLIGTFYGGNGQTTFALPNLQDSHAMHQGDGTGLSPRFLGEQSGVDFVTLLITEIPLHTHQALAKSVGGQFDPTGRTWAPSNAQKLAANFYATPQGVVKTMNVGALSLAGSSLPHNNLMPYLVMNFCIAMQGIFPPRS